MAIIKSQQINTSGNFFLPHRVLIHGPLKPKASVRPMRCGVLTQAVCFKSLCAYIESENIISSVSDLFKINIILSVQNIKVRRHYGMPLKRSFSQHRDRHFNVLNGR